ncbi:unnamed protein product [Clonostachys rosea]|uniref:Uncharacterized protein n=1 Tax=Bionectria ochroleuca TaxID=29856 RepID=A0ABY6UNW2_BIOOC|nr:unnamed protein product [Clonostachys rosea]
MTENCLKGLAEKLPRGVTVHGFTPEPPAPSAVEGRVDAVLSTAVCLRALAPIWQFYDGFLVCCFSNHPLISALREEVEAPVLGIMEAALYASRMCGNRLGVVTTSERSRLLHQQSITDYGLGSYSAGCASSNVSVLGLEPLSVEQLNQSVVRAAKELVEQRDADCCAGMTGMRETCEEALNSKARKVMVVDGVSVGVQFLVALARDGLGTAKGGVYRPAKAAREARNQDWF